MKILVTGTNGFIGRNLKEYLQNRYLELDFPKRDKLNLLDSRAVYRYLSHRSFDVIVHCGVTLQSVEENLKMYFNLERCSSHFGKLVCIGSGAEFDSRNYVPKMKEEHFGLHIPSDIYGFSKYVIAKDIQARERNIFNLRVFGIFGKYEDYNRRFISNNICRALCGQDLSVSKNMYFDYLYINDFSRILDLFINREVEHRTYNICRGESIDLLSLAEIIAETDGNGLAIEVIQEGLNREYSGTNMRFLEEFGPFDFTEFEDSIGELYRWYKVDSKIKFESSIFS